MSELSESNQNAAIHSVVLVFIIFSLHVCVRSVFVTSSSHFILSKLNKWANEWTFRWHRHSPFHIETWLKCLGIFQFRKWIKKGFARLFGLWILCVCGKASFTSLAHVFVCAQWETIRIRVANAIYSIENHCENASGDDCENTLATKTKFDFDEAGRRH